MQRFALIAALALGTGAPAMAQDAISDPFEKFNRSMFAFNEAVDKAALEPVARGYRAVTPEPVRDGVSNFLGNLRGPVVFANDVLQAEPKRAVETAVGFGINTTLGIGGLFDVAQHFGIERHSEDFGQTLGKWGVGSGPYLYLPLLGPSSLRDTAAAPVDAALNPLNYAEFDGDDAARAGRIALTVVNGRAGALDAVDRLRETSIDPYVTVRTSWHLLRQASIRNGREDVQDLPDFEEIPEPPAGEEPAPPATEGTTP